MYKRLLIFFSLFTAFTGVDAQTYNLVNNPSFEEFFPYDHSIASYCNDTLDRQDCPNGWVTEQVKNWSTPLWPLHFVWVTGERGGFYGTSTWYPAVPFFPGYGTGYQPAKEGKALIWGFLWDGRNFPHCDYSTYVETQLKQPLIGGAKYVVSFYVNKAGRMNYAINNIEALLTSYSTSTLPNDTCIINLEPQIKNKYLGVLTDTIGWQEIRDTMTAVGGEQYLTLGRFEYGATLDTVQTYFGADGEDLAIYMIDMVSVVPLDSLVGITQANLIEEKLNVQPNPVKDELCLNTTFTTLTIYNNKGQQVYLIADNKLRECSDVSFLSSGLYWIEITKRNQIYRTKFVKE